MRKNLVLLVLFVAAILVADPPPGYYDSAAGLSGESLKSALNSIIDNHTELSYSQVWTALKDTDRDPDNSDNVILLYTGWSVTNSGYPTWNREHVWAKSHGDFGTIAPHGTDIHHLRPTDPGVNSSRGNKDFDNGGTPHSVAIGCYSDSDSWEPRDEVKGDVARMIFYMAVRYEGEGGELDLVCVDAVNTAPLPQHGKLSTLLEWNMIDPPDEFEENRNDVIYEDYQGNRNPFVDDPSYANLIWQNIVADFDAEPASGEAPLVVQFTDTSFSSGDIINWSWDFDNDGTEDSTIQNPSYTYVEEGVYSVSLRVVDEYGEFVTNTKNDYILVGSTNIPITLFADSFEAGLNWTNYSVNSNYNWELSDDTSGSSHPQSVPHGDWYMHMNNFGANTSANDWIITPAVDLSSCADPYVNFMSWTKYSDSILGFSTWISTDYNEGENPENATWQELNANLPASNSAVWTNSGNVDISAYNEDIVHIAFQYTSTGTAASSTSAWSMDDVKIEGYEGVSTGNNLVLSDLNLNNYPNPFNPITMISFSLKSDTTENVDLNIYNLKGQKVKQLFTDRLSSGQNSVVWNGTDQTGIPVSSGIYFYQLEISGKTLASKKCLLLK